VRYQPYINNNNNTCNNNNNNNPTEALIEPSICALEQNGHQKAYLRAAVFHQQVPSFTSHVIILHRQCPNSYSITSQNATAA